LGALMIVVGFVVSLVLLDTGSAPDADAFSRLMGLPIFCTWVLFTSFYVSAIRRRRRPEAHKLLIILASAAALGAASFRILTRILGFGTGVAAAGSLAPVLFPVLGILHDRRHGRPVHPVYAWGVAAFVVVIGGAYLVGPTPVGEAMADGLARIGRAVRPLY
jgi:hypothetical protein